MKCLLAGQVYYLCADGFAWNGNQGGYFQMENSWDLNSTLMLISPPVLDLAPNRLKFNAQSSIAGAELLIGTMSNPADQNTFELLTSVTFTSAWVYEPFDVWLNGYTGTNNYFVIKHSNSSEYLTIQIDDIEVEALPTCLSPSDVFASDITTTSAIFNWTESGSATNWEIEIGALGFVPGTGAELNQYSHSDPFATEQSYDLTGLTAATVYDVYVLADCGGSDMSPWTGPVTFQTSFEAFTSLPVTEDFESGMSITGNNFENVTNWVINTDLQHGGLNSVHNPYTLDDDNVLFMLGTFDFTAKSDVMLSFWQIAKTDGNSDHCYVEISTDGGATYDQLPESTYFGAGNYREEGLYTADGPAFDEDSYADWGTGSEVPDNTWWKKEYFNLTDYNTFDNVVIRFRLWSDGYGNKAGWYLDDIVVETLGTPGFNVDPLTITENATPVMPAMVDMTMGNTGDFPATYTASVVYDETDLLTENFDAGIPWNMDNCKQWEQ